MFSENEKISLRQIQVLLIIDIFGTGIITLPRRTAEAAGTDAWLSVLLGGLIMIAYSFVVTSLAERFAGKSFIKISQELLTKPIGILVCIGFAVKILLTTGLQLRIFCEIIRQTMLFKTPIAVTVVTLILVAAYAAARGYECRARAGEILIVLIFIPLLVIYMTAFFSTDFSNLLPVFTTKPIQLIKGAGITVFAFQGLEMLLLAYPFLNHKKGNKNEIAATVGIIVILMVVTTVLTMGKFGNITVKSKMFPVLQMMDTVDLPGAFIERQDIFILWFWVVSAFAGVNAGIFFLSFLFSELSEERKKRKVFLIVMLPLLFFTAVIPKDISNAYSLLSTVTIYGGTFYLFVVPVILLILAILQNRGGKQNEKLS